MYPRPGSYLRLQIDNIRNGSKRPQGKVQEKLIVYIHGCGSIIKTVGESRYAKKSLHIGAVDRHRLILHRDYSICNSCTVRGYECVSFQTLQ